MTIYYVKLRWRSTGHEGELTFDSMLGRALAIISYASYADVIEQGERTK